MEKLAFMDASLDRVPFDLRIHASHLLMQPNAPWRGRRAQRIGAATRATPHCHGDPSIRRGLGTHSIQVGLHETR
jgi:hypothetical protein